MDSIDVLLRGKFRNVFVLRKNVDVAYKFIVTNKETNTCQIIDKCKLMAKKSVIDYELLKNINQFHVIEFKELFDDGEFMYFISEKNDKGTELYDYLRSLKRQNLLLEPNVAIYYVCQLINGLEFLHSHRILHSYLNTTDIYIYPNEMLKISGFYFFEVLPSEDAVSRMERKLFYKCPPTEMNEITLKYDYWCLGWIVYELCTLQNMRPYLEKADFNDFSRPEMAKFNVTLAKVFECLTKLDKDDRKSLKKLLAEKGFLGSEYFKYKNAMNKLQLVGQISKFDKYNLQIVEMLGSGGFGVAYRCIDLDDKQIKALKILNENDDETPQAELLMNLNHKNIAICLAYFKHNMRFCLLTEFCNGKDLDEFIKKTKNQGNTIEKKRVIEWSIQLFDALNYAHSSRVMHRDLKPANIMLNVEKETNALIIKLIDFGLSRKLDQNLQARTLCGTLPYMAPEIFNGPYEFKADIWSAGCVVYEMTEMEMAYKGNQHQIMMNIQTTTPKMKNNNFMIKILGLIFIHEPKDRADAKKILDMLKVMKLKNAEDDN